MTMTLTLEEQLKGLGYDVMGGFARTGARGRSICHAADRDLDSMDIGCARGRRAHEAAARIDDQRPVPILMLAVCRSRYNSQGRHAGALGYLVKPVNG